MLSFVLSPACAAFRSAYFLMAMLTLLPSMCCAVACVVALLWTNRCTLIPVEHVQLPAALPRSAPLAFAYSKSRQYWCDLWRTHCLPSCRQSLPLLYQTLAASPSIISSPLFSVCVRAYLPSSHFLLPPPSHQPPPAHIPPISYLQACFDCIAFSLCT